MTETKRGFSIALLVLALAALPYWAWTFSVLWGWFVVPLFHLPALTVPQALGLMVVKTLVTEPVNSTAAREHHVQEAAYLILTPLVSLGIGWIVLGFL